MTQRELNYYRIQKAIAYIENNYRRQPDLDEVAKVANLSPFHFQKLFVDWVGISPKKFMQYITVSYLRTKIQQTQNMIEAAEEVGFSSSSRVHDLFIHIEAVSPQQYKSSGHGLELFFGYHPSPFGLCFIAVTAKGICELSFIDVEFKSEALKCLQIKWPFASLSHCQDITWSYVEKIFPKNGNRQESLLLLVQGSAFKIKVWEALLKIPPGEVCSYKQLAQQLDCVHGERAIASAAGQNPISYLIPCHRIICKNGTVGQFHYGKVRKRMMLGWELAQANECMQVQTGAEAT